MDVNVNARRAMVVVGCVSTACVVAAAWAAGVVAWSIRSYLRGPSW